MTGPVRIAAVAGVLAAGLGGAALWRARSAGTETPVEALTRPATRVPPAAGDSTTAGPAPAGDHGSHAGDPMPGRDPMSAADQHPTPAGLRDSVVTLTPEMVGRAGIQTTAAAADMAMTSLQLPGVVQPNAYKTVTVTSLVSGRLTQVGAELGQHVALNDVLATVYSPEMAEAQTMFMAAVAEHVAHDQRRTRTQRLYAIGAASRQDLERLEAEKLRMDQEVETARTRLVLLGVPEARTQRLASPADVVTTFEVRAPAAGVVTSRTANTGLNIDTSTPLFTVVDLSTVWVIGDLYERDFAAVRVGSPVTVTTPSYPGLTLRARVAYIDPQVQADSRTAKLRVEVPNADGRLRFGMFVDVRVTQSSPRPVVLVPRASIQAIGGVSVVYVATADRGRFLQRMVDVGDAVGDKVAIVGGVAPGEQIVTAGAFFLRAEHERTTPDNAGPGDRGDVVFPRTTP